MLKSGGDTDLLEQIINLLVLNKKAVIAKHVEQQVGQTFSAANSENAKAQIEDSSLDNTLSELIDVNRDTNNVADGGGVAGAQVELEVGTHVAAGNDDEDGEELLDLLVDLKPRVRWLKALSSFDRFELAVRFTSNAVISDVLEMLDAQTDVKVSTARAKYVLGMI